MGCLAGSSKMAPRIYIFVIVLGGKYLSYVKSIATFALTFFGYIVSVLASVPTQAEKMELFFFIQIWQGLLHIIQRFFFEKSWKCLYNVQSASTYI